MATSPSEVSDQNIVEAEKNFRYVVNISKSKIQATYRATVTTKRE